MKLRNWVAVGLAITLVAIGNLVFTQVQNVKASEVNGTAGNITSTNITVGNKTLIIDSNTKIKGNLVSGSSIEIKAIIQDDGTLLATKIHVKNNEGHKQNGNSDSDGDDNEISGTIQSLSNNNTSMVINGQTVLINQATKIKGQLAVNARAEVEVVQQQDGSLLATKIEIKNNNNNKQNKDEGKTGQWHQDNGRHLGLGKQQQKNRD
ncbi:MAG: hypothetical protein HW384_1025 [Dehalococcoidia bacterium]|nr:hypothetical protein [Dehalococcoidia bacterium]